MPSTEYTIHEAYGFTVHAEVEYECHPASGDGWHEPREPAYVEFTAIKLVKLTSKLVRNNDGTLRTHWHSEDLGKAPQWVWDAINNDTDWQAELLANEAEYEPEYEREYD